MSRLFRNGRPDDLPVAAHLIHHSFPRPGRSVEECEALLTDPADGGLDRLWVAEVDGRLVGACRLLRYDQWIAGETIPIMGLSAVAVSPSARRLGIAAELVTSAMRASRERGDVASLLYPFRTSFYQRLGYGMAGEALQYVLPIRALRDHPGRSRVDVVLAEAERESVSALYERWAPTSTGQLVRPAHAWRPIWDGGSRHGAVYRDEAGAPQGYLVFRYQPDGHGRSAIEVEEAVWLTPDARLGLYGWIASLADQWDLVVYRAHPEERFEEYVRELRNPVLPPMQRWHYWFPAAVKMMGPMFRLLDVPGAWSARRLNAGEPLSVALSVTDAQLTGAPNQWNLRLEDGRAEPMATDSGAPDITIETDIETLSRVYIGSLDLAGAMVIGRAKVDRADRIRHFDALLAVPSPWTFDRF